MATTQRTDKRKKVTIDEALDSVAEDLWYLMIMYTIDSFNVLPLERTCEFIGQVIYHVLNGGAQGHKEIQWQLDLLCEEVNATYRRISPSMVMIDDKMYESILLMIANCCRLATERAEKHYQILKD